MTAFDETITGGVESFSFLVRCDRCAIEDSPHAALTSESARLWGNPSTGDDGDDRTLERSSEQLGSSRGAFHIILADSHRDFRNEKRFRIVGPTPSAKDDVAHEDLFTFGTRERSSRHWLIEEVR